MEWQLLAGMPDGIVLCIVVGHYGGRRALICCTERTQLMLDL
jgi:hypothetical protein